MKVPCRGALDGDVAAGLLDAAAHRGEAKTGAFAWFLGREEGLEDLVERRLVHANARVAHGKHDVRTGRDAEVPVVVFRAHPTIRRLDR